MSAQCNLIIDSCCDLPLELVQQEGVQLIDFNYIIDDETFKDDFYQSVTPKEFYDNIRNGATPSTSQVAPAETEAAFRNAIESGVPTVYLCFSSGLSSNYSTAYAIWSQLKAEHPEAPIYIVDLLIGSTPEGLLVLEALRQRESGLPPKRWLPGRKKHAISCRPCSWLTTSTLFIVVAAFPLRSLLQAPSLS